MAELTFLSNKTWKEYSKYFFLIVLAITTWILQTSIFNRFQYFNAAPDFMLLGVIYMGLMLGPTCGVLFGIISSFFTASVLYDHVFYFSYPLIGLFAGLLTKNLFSDELLLFIILSFILTFPLEFLNGWQYSIKNSLNIQERLLMVSFYGAITNLIVAPFYYLTMNFFAKRSKLISKTS